MSLTDKVIKNTFYHTLSQILSYVFPILLIPIIISKIGTTEFGIYVIAYGFVGILNLLDAGVSTSYVRFISEYYNKKDIFGLNCIINSGIVFYLMLTTILGVLGYFFLDLILKYINIPIDIYETAKFSFHICLLIFIVATNANMFISILISLQKMYINSLLNIVILIINFIIIIIILHLGYGLKGIMLGQLSTSVLSTILSIFLAFKFLPEMKIGFRYLKLNYFKKMLSFGVQMQVSKISSFLSEKYDEYLLSFFSIMNNVTFFNISSRIVRLGKNVPMILFQQVAPVAAELNAKDEKDKLNRLFSDTTKYLSITSIPIFTFIFVFADLIIYTWIGNGYELSVFLLRVLIIGQVINSIMSAPGNSIIPNIGIPKYQMHESLIGLIINLILTFFLIKYFGIFGAAYGTTLATVISSLYIYYTSLKFFNRNLFLFFFKFYIAPLFVSILSVILVYAFYKLFNFIIPYQINRFFSLGFLIIGFVIFCLIFLYLLLKTSYLDDKNRESISKTLNFIPFIKIKIK
ncbi:MAG: oligosaccharide flippase family protein [Ignavibacteria bacterium]|nr:oligosaccharide flippase family protein [Ignavibacteria bacterium]